MIALSVLASVSLFAASDVSASESGSTLFQFGLGLSKVTYPDFIDSELSDMESAGADRVTVALNANLGFRIVEGAYLMLGVNGVGDRLEYQSFSLQLNHYLYGVGLRLYPGNSGVYLQGMYGKSALVLQVEDYGYSDSESTDGAGFGAALGIEMGKPKGFGLALEASLLNLDIEEETFASGSVMLNLRWR
jgi:hypothetical protein